MFVDIRAYDRNGLVINPPRGMPTDQCGVFLTALSSLAGSNDNPIKAMKSDTWLPSMEEDSVGYLITRIIESAENGLAHEPVVTKDQTQVLLDIFTSRGLTDLSDGRIREELIKEGRPHLANADAEAIKWFRDELKSLLKDMKIVTRSMIGGYIGVVVTPYRNDEYPVS